MNNRVLRRKAFQKFYKEQRWREREVGLQLNKLWQEFHSERAYLEKNREKPDPETIKYLGQLAKQIRELKEQPLFRRDFPSFSSFYKYAKKEKVKLSELTQE
jgi:hypothetical protein